MTTISPGAPARIATAPPPTAAIVAIALNTFREAIRDKILYLLLVFALILIGTARLLSMLTVGDEQKIIKDVGLSAISLFGVMTAVFVGVSLVFKEIERRTVYTLLANPVRRWQFVGGKFLGLMCVLAMNVGLMSLALFAIVAIRGESPLPLLPAIFLLLVELAVITAFALLFSTVTNPTLAAVWTFAAYVMGHLSWSMQLLKQRVPEGIARVVCDVVYWLLPNLERLNLKGEVVHGIERPDGWVPLAAAYGLGYALVVLVLACVAFERRDFK
ncbi:MAG: ABC transporter permease subunit [bacterium]|nr:ABC transporter permease subunit [bacterium]